MDFLLGVELVVVREFLAGVDRAIRNDEHLGTVDLGIAIGLAGVIHAGARRRRIAVDECAVLQIEEPDMIGAFAPPLGFRLGDALTCVFDDTGPFANAAGGKCPPTVDSGATDAVADGADSDQSSTGLSLRRCRRARGPSCKRSGVELGVVT